MENSINRIKQSKTYEVNEKQKVVRRKKGKSLTQGVKNSPEKQATKLPEHCVCGNRILIDEIVIELSDQQCRMARIEKSWLFRLLVWLRVFERMNDE
jgi:hypothetical protein